MPSWLVPPRCRAGAGDGCPGGTGCHGDAGGRRARSGLQPHHQRGATRRPSRTSAASGSSSISIPKDFTGGCTLEAHNFQRDLAKYEKANAVILGVSVDTAESHKSFCAKEGLAFKLFSDPDAKVSTEYGSVMEYNGAKLAARNTFIVNPDGKIAKVFSGVKPSEHSEEVLTALASLQAH